MVLVYLRAPGYPLIGPVPIAPTPGVGLREVKQLLGRSPAAWNRIDCPGSLSIGGEGNPISVSRYRGQTVSRAGAIRKIDRFAATFTDDKDLPISGLTRLIGDEPVLGVGWRYA